MCVRLSLHVFGVPRSSRFYHKCFRKATGICLHSDLVISLYIREEIYLRQTDPRKQFSKKLASRAEWFWFFYMVGLAVVLALTPASSMAAVYLAVLVTCVMMVSVMAYTSNSKYDKFLYTLRTIERIQSGSGKEEEDEEEGDNG